MKQAIQWRNSNDKDENIRIAKEGMIDFKDDPGMTLQAPAEEQDINVIMKRFGVKDGSVIPRWNDANAMYGDFSEVPTDPIEAAEYIRKGNVAFAALPAEVRRKFDSGAHLHNWLREDKNKEEAITLGLLSRPAAPRATLDTLDATLQKVVSSSTSSDKGTNLTPPKPPEGGSEK